MKWSLPAILTTFIVGSVVVLSFFGSWRAEYRSESSFTPYLHIHSAPIWRSPEPTLEDFRAAQALRGEYAEWLPEGGKITTTHNWKSWRTTVAIVWGIGLAVILAARQFLVWKNSTYASAEPFEPGSGSQALEPLVVLAEVIGQSERLKRWLFGMRTLTLSARINELDSIARKLNAEGAPKSHVAAVRSLSDPRVYSAVLDTLTSGQDVDPNH